MKKIKRCEYSGGESCVRQGGNGSSYHKSNYSHKYPTLTELGKPVEDPTDLLIRKSDEVRSLCLDVEEFFNDELSEAVLSLSFSEIMDPVDVVSKSLYDFDLDTEKGVNKLLELLPILDAEIMREVMAEIWPGYPVDDVDPKLVRAEIKGYLMDYLEDNGSEQAL